MNSSELEKSGDWPGGKRRVRRAGNLEELWISERDSIRLPLGIKEFTQERSSVSNDIVGERSAGELFKKSESIGIR
jgi:hypothetical protein